VLEVKNNNTIPLFILIQTSYVQPKWLTEPNIVSLS